LRQTPNLEYKVPVFMSPSDRRVQLYPQAPGSLFVAFYWSQGYGGGILIRLHTRSFKHYMNFRLQRTKHPPVPSWNVEVGVMGSQ
jgi:hypothetical protein